MLLGLNATISNHPYEVTGEEIEPGQANFITCDALLQFLREYGEVALRVAQQLEPELLLSLRGNSDAWAYYFPGREIPQTAAFLAIRETAREWHVSDQADLDV